MPQIKQQKKRVLTNEKRRIDNKAKKSALRTEIKRVLAAVKDNDKELAISAFDSANSRLDKLVSDNIYHRNYAARQKARLAKAVNSLD